jgi:hypothetical protein
VTGGLAALVVVVLAVRTGAGGAAGANRKISSDRPAKPKTTARNPYRTSVLIGGPERDGR